MGLPGASAPLHFPLVFKRQTAPLPAHDARSPASSRPPSLRLRQANRPMWNPLRSPPSREPPPHSGIVLPAAPRAMRSMPRRASPAATWEPSHGLFLEVGWTKIETSRHYGPIPPVQLPSQETRSDLEELYDYFNFCVDIVPGSLLYKYEHPITSWLNFFAGIGAGVAFTDASFMGDSRNDSTFDGQILAGLTLPFSESFEAFGGGRWYYLNELKGPPGIDLGSVDVVAVEGGSASNSEQYFSDPYRVRSRGHGFFGPARGGKRSGADRSRSPPRPAPWGIKTGSIYW